MAAPPAPVSRETAVKATAGAVSERLKKIVVARLGYEH
jgi:hypothetical protein